MPRLIFCIALLLSGSVIRAAVQDPTEGSRNQPQRLEWFRDAGFGLFIHWNVDAQLGTVISHSLVGASDDYLRRYFDELPRTFNPRRFQPDEWAELAKLAGVRYVVFTAKHHAGFCFWPTATTSFDIAHTPFQRDITGEVLASFRKQGIAPGLYFSPDDFWWLWRNQVALQRNVPAVMFARNPGLLAHDQAQVRELLTRYGQVDVLFFDGEAEGLRELAWDLQPNIVVTRGAIATPEQNVPGVPLEGAWEACLTMGKAWGYQPTLESYKSGAQCISLLVETRAKGGNLLLNIGPKPNGEIPLEQEERLREIALWMYVNSECIYGVRPWVITNERDVWFTKAKDADTVYAIVKAKNGWQYGEWRELVLQSVRATPQTEISVLGQNGQVLEYRSDVVPTPTYKAEKDGLHIRAMFAHRLRDDRTWPNPVVLKLTHVAPALVPPRVQTQSVKYDRSARLAQVEGELNALGDAPSVEVGCEWRDITGLDSNDRPDTWSASPLVPRTTSGAFRVSVPDLRPGRTYELRAVVKHPLLTIPGKEVRLRVP